MLFKIRTQNTNKLFKFLLHIIKNTHYEVRLIWECSFYSFVLVF
jgi:hypothetical protein